MKDYIEYIDSIESSLLEIRKWLHQYPELSFKEFKTTNFIYEKLKNTDIQLSKLEDGTGLIGDLIIDKKKPTIAIRADIDALPIKEETNLSYKSKNENIMHACGHDIHTTVLIGTALTLDKHKENLNGNIRFIFQPAEEKLGGAKYMIEKNALKEVDDIICLHTWPFINTGEIGVRHGPIMASSSQFKVVINGTGDHAAHPHKSIDPIPVASKIIDGIQDITSRKLAPLSPAVITIGQINGGTADNIIASDVTLSGTVRTFDDEVDKLIQKNIELISSNIAKAFDTTVNVEYQKVTPPVINNNILVDIMDRAISNNLGHDSLVHLEEPSLGSEDFSFYLEKANGMLFRLGTGNDNPNSRLGLHNPKIIFDEKAINFGVKAMCLFVEEYFN